jgi:hypothetical protein
MQIMLEQRQVSRRIESYYEPVHLEPYFGKQYYREQCVQCI